MVRGLFGAVALLTVLGVAGCGEDAESASADPAPSDRSTSPAQDLSFEEVCDRVEEIYPKKGQLPTQDELDDIREDLRDLGQRSRALNSTPVGAALMKLPVLEATDPSEFDEGRGEFEKLCALDPTPSAQALPSYDEWVRTADEKTGVVFRFPAGVEPIVRNQPVGGQMAEVRVYQTGEPISASLAFSELPSGVPAPDLRYTFSRLKASLTAQGGDDVTVSGLRDTEVRGRSAVEGLVRFTATDGFKNYWPITAFMVGRTRVVVQTISFSPPAQVAEVAPQVDAVQRRLLAGVRLPG